MADEWLMSGHSSTEWLIVGGTNEQILVNGGSIWGSSHPSKSRRVACSTEITGWWRSSASCCEPLVLGSPLVLLSARGNSWKSEHCTWLRPWFYGRNNNCQSSCPAADQVFKHQFTAWWLVVLTHGQLVVNHGSNLTSKEAFEDHHKPSRSTR